MPLKGVEMDWYADRRGSAGAATVGGRAARWERMSGLPRREHSNPLTKPAAIAAVLKPDMTERVVGAPEMGAVTEMAAADGNGRRILLLSLNILGAEDGSTGRGEVEVETTLGITEGEVETGDDARSKVYCGDRRWRGGRGFTAGTGDSVAVEGVVGTGDSVAVKGLLWRPAIAWRSKVYCGDRR